MPQSPTKTPLSPADSVFPPSEEWKIGHERKLPSIAKIGNRTICSAINTAATCNLVKGELRDYASCHLFLLYRSHLDEQPERRHPEKQQSERPSSNGQIGTHKRGQSLGI